MSSQRRNDSFHLLLVFLFIPSLSASLLPPQVSYLPLSLQLFSLLQVGVSNTEIGEQTPADGRRMEPHSLCNINISERFVYVSPETIVHSQCEASPLHRIPLSSLQSGYILRYFKSKDFCTFSFEALKFIKALHSFLPFILPSSLASVLSVIKESVSTNSLLKFYHLLLSRRHNHDLTVNSAPLEGNKKCQLRGTDTFFIFSTVQKNEETRKTNKRS